MEEEVFGAAPGDARARASLLGERPPPPPPPRATIPAAAPGPTQAAPNAPDPSGDMESTAVEDSRTEGDGADEEDTEEDSGSPPSAGKGIGKKAASTTTRLLDMASKAFRKKVASSPGGGQTASYDVLEEPVQIDSGHPVVAAGAPCGHLLRYFTTLSKLKRLFYVLDSPRGLLYELDANGAGHRDMRTVISLRHVRVSDAVETFETPELPIWGFKLFVRAAGPEIANANAKVIVLGAPVQAKAQSWWEAMRKAVGSFGVRSPTSARVLGSDQTQAIVDVSPLGSTGAGAAPEAASWTQDLMVAGEIHRVPCTSTSTNAWLLSEAIRIFIKSHDGCEPDPPLTQIVNVTRNTVLSLEEDVRRGVAPGDVLQAREAPAPTSPKRGRLRRGSPRHSISNASEFSLRAPSEWARAAADNRPGGCTCAHIRLARVANLDLLREAIDASSHFADDRAAVHASLKRQLETLCASFSATVPNWPSQVRTKPLGSAQGVMAFTAGSDGVLGVTSVAAPPRAVLKVLLDARRLHEWNPHVASATYLEVGSQADVLAVEARHALSRAAGNPVLLPRRFCVARVWLELADGSVLLLSCPSDHFAAENSGSDAGWWAAGALTEAVAIRPLCARGCGQASMVFALSGLDLVAPVAPARANRAARVAWIGALAGACEAALASR